MNQSKEASTITFNINLRILKLFTIVLLNKFQMNIKNHEIYLPTKEEFSHK